MIVDKGATVSEVYNPGELPASAVFTDPIMHAVRSVLRDSQTAGGICRSSSSGFAFAWVSSSQHSLCPGDNPYRYLGFRGGDRSQQPGCCIASNCAVAAEPVTASDIQSELGKVLELGKLYPIKQHQVKNGLRMVHAMGLAPEGTTANAF